MAKPITENEKGKEPQILIIDDEADFGDYVSEVAKSLKYTCVATVNATDFKAALNPNVQLVILDLIMPDVDGIEILRYLNQQNCKSKILLMSGFNKRVLEVASDLAKELKLTVVGHVQKPVRKAELEKILNTAMELAKETEIKKPIKAQSTVDITKELIQEGLDKDQFLVYYQPQVHIPTKRLVGLEVLVRWQHPIHGLIMPDSFISKAEALNMIDDLGWRVAEKSFKEMGAFISKNDNSPTMSVNVSPYTLLNLKFPDMLLELAKTNNIRPDKLMVEVTESGLFKDLSSALDILTRLRMKNIKLSIDDFGTGYASMQQLGRIPANELKIDQSFVRQIHEQESARVMVVKIIEMAHALDMKALAEGVETEEQLEYLHVNQCDIAQGYLYSRPIPYNALMDWVKTTNPELLA